MWPGIAFGNNPSGRGAMAISFSKLKFLVDKYNIKLKFLVI
jgi:hypothetical protein